MFFTSPEDLFWERFSIDWQIMKKGMRHLLYKVLDIF